ncbi:MAG TPA: histidine kinase dimerization/phospho-acceptor domain-containing protein, partial [Nevskiaceae bacterium]|nr:histidine kinase dimerization/phospho-acceptor domain-containing protein [Nevskiaceae bacterium]
MADPAPAVAQAAFEALTTAVMVLDAALVIVAVNAAAERLFGVSRSHAVGSALLGAVPAFGGCAPRLQRALADDAGFTERELDLSSPLAPERLVDCTVTPLHATGRVGGLQLELTALGERLRIVDDAHHAVHQQVGRELLRNLAHEIKNPLGGIRGAAQLLDRELRVASLREYTGIII